MKPIRAIAVLPTLFTLGNLLCGFFAVVVLSRIEKPITTEIQPAPMIEPSLHAAKELFGSSDPTLNLMLAGALILCAMLLDAVDGQLARLTRGSSDFGAYLDSLADLVSFGVAPAILLVKLCPEFTFRHSGAIWSIAALFACCAALRLARFNVELDSEEDHTAFAGLPTPAAAAAVASFAILSYMLRNEVNVGRENFAAYDWWMQRLLPLFSAVIALLMVSRIRYPHPLTQFIRGQQSFAHLVGIVFALVAVSFYAGYAVPLLCVLFVCAPPVKLAWVHLCGNAAGATNRCFRLVGQAVPDVHETLRHSLIYIMFTGIVQSLAEVVDVKSEPPGVRLVIREPQLGLLIKIGDSVALNGCCLTAVDIAGGYLSFQAGEETLSRTNMGELEAGDLVNVEPSVHAGEPLGGHYVTGHIDAVAIVDDRYDSADWCTMWFRAPAAQMRQMASKGSIAVDGVSLTLVAVEADRFSVALIPHTLANTTLGRRRVGDRVNIETDVLAKYVERALSRMLDTGGRGTGNELR